MQIENCTTRDVDTILRLYEAARSLQISKGMVVWSDFDKQFIETEIDEKRQWKLLINEEIACN
jgi:hypothetical protein